MLKLTPIPQTLSLLIISLFTAFGVSAKDRCLKTNTPQNITICAQLADSGDSQAQNTLGEIYYQDALIHPGYHTKARILFEKAAAQGLAAAQYNLGAIYRDEFNNFPIALVWFEKAAAQGNSDAQNSIGYIYENGSGGGPPRPYIFDEQGKNIDPELPFIEAKYAPYDFQLPEVAYPRIIYPISDYGQGVEPDVQKAAQWYQTAANQGNALAQTNLAYFYLFGIGVEKDEQRAFTLYQAAAKQHFAPALKSLAFMYMQGLGTPEDIPQAFHAMEQAYQIQPDDLLWHLIKREMSSTYSLVTTLSHIDITYRKWFNYPGVSDEDHIHERLNFFKRLYYLDFMDGGIGALYAWPRPIQSIVVGDSIGENSVLKKRFTTKHAIQGYYPIITLLSNYYKAEEQDMANAQLWMKYAIKMGESPHLSYDAEQATDDDN